MHIPLRVVLPIASLELLFVLVAGEPLKVLIEHLSRDEVGQFPPEVLSPYKEPESCGLWWSDDADEPPSSRLHGSRDSMWGEFPSVGFVFSPPRCTFTMVTEQIALTLGSCLVKTNDFFEDQDRHLEERVLYQGIHMGRQIDYNVDPTDLTVRTSCVPSAFVADKDQLDRNMAAIILDRKLQFNESFRVSPICLPTGSVRRAPEQYRANISIVGWGSQKDYNNDPDKGEVYFLYPNKLQALAVNVRGEKGNLSASLQLLRRSDKHDICRGDQGAPLVGYEERTVGDTMELRQVMFGMNIRVTDPCNFTYPKTAPLEALDLFFLKEPLVGFIDACIEAHNAFVRSFNTTAPPEEQQLHGNFPIPSTETDLKSRHLRRKIKTKH